jgi:hypothetical protein
MPAAKPGQNVWNVGGKDIIRKSPAYLRAKGIVDDSWPSEQTPYVFSIPVTDIRLMTWTLVFIEMYAKDRFGYDYKTIPCYNDRKIFLYNTEVLMDFSLCFEIPYASRSKYANLLAKVNGLITDGNVLLFVNNNPYSLESLAFVVSSDEREIDCAKKSVREYGLNIRLDKGLNELLAEIGERKWNFCTLALGQTTSDILEKFRTMYWYAEKDELAQKGYTERSHTKPSLFISYCHSDKDLVYTFIDHLENCGVRFWIDKQDLESGTSLISSIMSGLRECDMSVSFISSHMKDSVFGQSELMHILTAYIKSKKPWTFVRVDDVDVDDILPGLSDYVYIDYAGGATVGDILNDILRKYNKLHSK